MYQVEPKLSAFSYSFKVTDGEHPEYIVGCTALTPEMVAQLIESAVNQAVSRCAG